MKYFSFTLFFCFVNPLYAIDLDHIGPMDAIKQDLAKVKENAKYNLMQLCEKEEKGDVRAVKECKKNISVVLHLDKIRCAGIKEKEVAVCILTGSKDGGETNGAFTVSINHFDKIYVNYIGDLD